MPCWPGRHEARARGSLDLLGPSTTAAIARLQAGAPPEESGRNGVDERRRHADLPGGHRRRQLRPGPARRPCGRGEPGHPLHLGRAGRCGGCRGDGVAVRRRCRPRRRRSPTPYTRRMLPSSRGGGWPGRASRDGSSGPSTTRRGPDPRGASPTSSSTWSGTSLATQESVPAAFALVTAYGDDPWQALCTAAQLGGDSDTIAAMTGAMLGAACGRSALPDQAIRQVAEVNRLDLDAVARRLLDIRWVVTTESAGRPARPAHADGQHPGGPDRAGRAAAGARRGPQGRGLGRACRVAVSTCCTRPGARVCSVASPGATAPDRSATGCARRWPTSAARCCCRGSRDRDSGWVVALVEATRRAHLRQLARRSRRLRASGPRRRCGRARPTWSTSAATASAWRSGVRRWPRGSPACRAGNRVFCDLGPWGAQAPTRDPADRSSLASTG